MVGVGCARIVGLTGSLCLVSLPLCYFGGGDGFQVMVVCYGVVVVVVKVFFFFAMGSNFGMGIDYGGGGSG